MPSEPMPPVRPRPRRRTEAPANGGGPPEVTRETVDADPDERDWQRGAEALARMPAARRLGYLRHLQDSVRQAEQELAAQVDHHNRLRYEPEAMLESGIGEKLGARVLAGISTDPPAPMVIGRLDPLGHTILYGTGGVGKGTLSAWWGVELLNDGKRLLIVDYENHPDEWARRIHGLGAGTMTDRVLHVAPLTAAWGGKRGPIWTQADDLRQLAMDFGADQLFIDSIVPACAGTDPLKPEAVSLYAGALEFIGLPVLSLAHVTKADDLRYPFGSIFWHNLSRTTWSLKLDGPTPVLAHRKHNNYERVAPMRVDVTWNEDGLPVSLWERSYSEDLTRRISATLVGEPLTVAKICEALDDEMTDDDAAAIKSDTVRKALRRGEKALPPKFVREGSDRWRNAE